MRSNPMRRRSASRWRAFGVVAGFLTLVAGATASVLSAAGVDLAFWRRSDALPPGWVAVPASSGPIPAYTKLTREHVFDSTKGRLTTIPMRAEEVTADILIDHQKIFGRVLDHDKPPGYVFTERDFLPKGARAGVVAGIPSGKRSFTLPADKLAGVFGLKVGDHVDLVASQPIDSKNGARSTGLAASLAARQQMATMRKRATVRVLAQDAVVVSPVTTRNKPVTSTTLASGATTRTVPVQEIVIAVGPEEVAPITEAIATQVEITCIGRSGLPDDPGAKSQTPGADPLDEMHVVETISGKKLDAQVFSFDGRRLPRRATGPDSSEQTAARAAGDRSTLVKD